MQKSTASKQKESSPTPTNANEIHNNNSNLINRTKIEGTPFTMITQIMDNDKTKSFIVIGDHRLTEPTDTEEQSLQKLITENWLIVTNMIAIITEKMLQQKSIDKQFTYDIEKQTVTEQPYETEESLSKPSIVTEAINKYKQNHPETKIVKV